MNNLYDSLAPAPGRGYSLGMEALKRYVTRPKTARLHRWIAARNGGAFAVATMAKALNMTVPAARRRLYLMRPAVEHLGGGKWRAIP